MNSKLLVTTQPGMATRVIPLAPLHDHAARIELPANVQELIGEGPNYGVVQSTGSSTQLWLGPTSVALDPPYHNGTKPNPDLRILRALAIECVSTAPTGPAAWEGDPEMRRTFGYIADAGEPNASQTAAAALLTAWKPDEIFTVGDFSYSVEADGSTGLNADLAAFAAFIAASKLFPVLGNHEWDAAGIMALLDAKFPYVTAFPGTSYYDKLITDEDGKPFAHLLFLDGGRKSNWTAIGAGTTGGAGPGSTQWNWMLDQIAEPDRFNVRWRIACVHWPMTTGVAGSTIMPELVALARSGHFDLILCGHTHSNEELVVHGVPVLNISTASQEVRTATDNLYGAFGDVQTVWKDSARHCITRLRLTPHTLTWEVFDLANSAAPIRTRTITPRTVKPLGSYTVLLQDGVTGVSQDIKCQFKMQAGDSVLLKWPQGLPFTGNAAHLTVSGNLEARHTLLRAVAIGF